MKIIKSIILKNKSKIIVAVVIAILTGLVGFLWNRMNHYIDESKRKDTIIFTQTKDFYTKDSIHVIQTTQQQMTINEYESLHRKDVEKLNSMGIKVKNLQDVITFEYKNNGTFTPNSWYADTIYWGINDTILDTVRVEKDFYKDDYLTYSRTKIQLPDTKPIVTYQYSDSIIIAKELYHNIKHFPKFLPRLRGKIGRKNDVRINVSFGNKATQVKGLEFISIKK